MAGSRTVVTVTIDTEEDNWGSFAESGATTDNILHLRELQELLSRWGARPTYFVNRPPLLASESIGVLGLLSEMDGVEIGGHCHPWNTPPSTGEGPERSMMCNLPLAANREKIAEVTRLLRSELGVDPRSFRTGRWGFGPTVSGALAAEGYIVDSSVSPFVDWRAEGGPDYTAIDNRPYRFDPTHPFEPRPDGSMVEIPSSVGYLSGRHRQTADLRRRIEESPLRRLKVIGLMHATRLMQRRWFSPESSSAEDMIRLAETFIRAEEPVLDLTFHSCTLLPGATPFVRDEVDRRRFLSTIDRVLEFCARSGLEFRTMGEIGDEVLSSAGQPS